MMNPEPVRRQKLLWYDYHPYSVTFGFLMGIPAGIIVAIVIFAVWGFA